MLLKYLKFKAAHLEDRDVSNLNELKRWIKHMLSNKNYKKEYTENIITISQFQNS